MAKLMLKSVMLAILANKEVQNIIGFRIMLYMRLEAGYSAFTCHRNCCSQITHFAVKHCVFST